MTTQLENLIETLRGRGHRITTPRRWTLKVLLEEHRHLTCEQIHRRLVEQGIHADEATVYRTLQWLKHNRVVAQTAISGGADVYSLLGEERHHHLICVECGATIELDDALFVPLRETIRAEYRFTPYIDHYAIFGVCEDCQEKMPSS
jgi:Fur family ferric uptake transcriptional regulator